MWVWIAAIALLAVLFYGTREGLQGWTSQNGKDYVGADLAGSNTKKKYADCAKSCTSNPSCKMFVTDVTSGTGTCWLKSTYTGSAFSNPARNARKVNHSEFIDGNPFRCDGSAGSLQTGGINIYRYTKEKVADVGSLYPNNTVEASWDPNYNSTRNVDCTGIQAGPELKTYTLPEGWKMKSDTMYTSTGPNLLGTVQGYADTCVKACQDNPKCKVAVHVPGSGLCSLYSELSGKTTMTGYNSYIPPEPAATESVPTTTESVPTTTESVPTTTESVPTTTESVPTTTESVPPTALPAGYTLFKSDTQYEGKYTSPSTPVADVSDCMTACSGLPGCQGIGSNSTNECRLYSEFYETSAALSGYSTYKYSPPLQPIDAPPAAEPSTSSSSVPSELNTPLRRFYSL